ncbi:MAG: hotdog domain-containing protein [Candidatus Obscuribacterales bacterium]
MNCQTKCPAIRVVMFPKDTNPSGNIFGGVILSNIDIAAGVAARAATMHRTVTVCMKEVIFKRPVKVGDILTFWADIIKTGRTSVTIRIKVEAERRGETIPVTEGEAIFVAVDEKDRPIPLDSPLGTQGVDDPADAVASSGNASANSNTGTGTDSTATAAPAPTPVTAPAEASDKPKKNKKNKKGKKGGKKNKCDKKDKKSKK